MKLKVTKSRSAAKEEEVREPENIAVVDDAAKTMDDAMPEDDEAVRETVAKEEITEEVAKEEKEEKSTTDVAATESHDDARAPSPLVTLQWEGCTSSSPLTTVVPNETIDGMPPTVPIARGRTDALIAEADSLLGIEKSMSVESVKSKSSVKSMGSVKSKTSIKSMGSVKSKSSIKSKTSVKSKEDEGDAEPVEEESPPAVVETTPVEDKVVPAVEEERVVEEKAPSADVVEEKKEIAEEKVSEK